MRRASIWYIKSHVATALTSDGLKLYVEETGTGYPVLFLHEFAGDFRSWEAQVRALSRRYRCITYNARGYPPSDVPTDPSAYSQQRAVDDAVAVLDALECDSAHIVGISMGGFCALHLALRHPERTRSLVVAGCGYGAQPQREASFRAECQAIAEAFEEEGAERFGWRYAQGPARVQLERKDPRTWTEFAAQLAEHSSVGSALTMRGVQGARPSLYSLTEELAALTVPTLVITGDEDEGCLEPGLMLKRTIPTAGLAVLPKTGHTSNLEEPELFNRTLTDFLGAVENDAWGQRDPRSVTGGVMGMGSSKADHG